MSTAIWVAIAFVVGFAAGGLVTSFRYVRAFARLRELEAIKEEAERVADHIASCDDPAEAMRILISNRSKNSQD
jgi:uncharacterized membrane protein YciS (DUF1049 family)